MDGRRVTEPGTRVIPGTHRVTLDNAPLDRPPSRFVLMLNKPAGVVSTVSDPQGRPTVLDLCRRYTRSRRLYPVGRLDINTTGLILLTNDGLLCYRLTHPRYQIPRTYHVRVHGLMHENKLAGLRRLTSPGAAHPSIELVRRGTRDAILRITLREGRNRQVRRMCEKVGLRVTRLRRVKFGPLTVRGLPLGAARPLNNKELASIDHLVS